jgi:hypothetical protein
MKSTLEPIPEYCELIPIEEFIQAVKFICFVPDDGSGYYATKYLMSDIDLDWKELRLGIYDKQWTHIAWFNK